MPTIYSKVSVYFSDLKICQFSKFQFNADMLTDSEKCELQDIVYIPKVAAGPVLPNKSEFRELIKIR